MSTYQQTFTGPPILLSDDYATQVLFDTSASKEGSKTSKFRVLSWNLLAPVYNRKMPAEKVNDMNWKPRLQQQLQVIEDCDADIICLQEFWCTRSEFVSCWQEWADRAGYAVAYAPRTNGKQDGVCTLVRASNFSISGVKVWSYNDWGDRVCMGVVCDRSDSSSSTSRMLVLNTHLTFPHPNQHDPVMRIHQARKLREIVQSQLNVFNDMSSVSAGDFVGVVLCGDMNGGIEDEAISMLFTKQDSEADAAGADGMPLIEPHSRSTEWVSHIAHNGNLMGCDFVATAGAANQLQFIKSTLVGNFDQEACDLGCTPSDHLPLLAELSISPSSS